MAKDDFDEWDDEEQVLPDEVTDTDLVDDTPDEDEPEAKGPDKSAAERARERAERERLAQELAEYKQRTEELAAKLSDLDQWKQDAGRASDAESIDAKLKELREKRVAALDAGRYDEAEELNDEAVDLRVRKAELKRSPPKAPEPKGEQQQQPPKKPYIPSAQQEWIDSNDWYHNQRNSQKIAQAHQAYISLLNQGFDPEDPNTYKELDKRLMPRKAPPPTLRPSRGDLNGGGKNRITQDDLDKMKTWGLDTNDEATRKEWLRNKTQRART